MVRVVPIPLNAVDRRPSCPQCGSRMTLVRVCPDRPGYDQKNYECGKCNKLVVEVVKRR